MATTLKNYADVQTLLNSFVASAGVTPSLAPHHVFWQALSYEQFITGNVPGVSGNYKILVVGNSAQSNIIMALSGTPNSPFDPNKGTIGQMPYPNAPYNSANPSQNDVITALAAWIDAGCPNGSAAKAKAKAPAAKAAKKPAAKKAKK